MKLKFDKRPKYIVHLILILIAMFISYPIGNYILSFQQGTPFMIVGKMFGWFIIILYLADNIFENIMKV